ncbi:type VI secretion system baseplate subunit TssE [Sphingomonas profundi]|uniref:type VI secretion system baseplate subunit TssE n=1 Tax=Alterirhizorhabdus profundi TaxID=2681549 RepID=UPI0012E83686|nr:type VI secretion system baseplate subunit TssE [Sphingomonas profundi]
MSGPLLSALDRLLDDAPDERFEVPDDEDAALRRLKQGLRRDLEGLLNGRRPFSPWLGRMPGLADSVIGFGLPDLSTEDFGTPAVRERIRRMIATCIRTYETRLSRVEVELDAGGPTSTGIRFRITAAMLVDQVEEPVIYDARLRPTDRAIVNLAR